MRTDRRLYRILGGALVAGTASLILWFVAHAGTTKVEPLNFETTSSRAELERANPPIALPDPPAGSELDLAALPDPPTEQTVRLGRWLFYDPRLSVDGTVSCATCHRQEHGFSEPTAPPVLNAEANIEPLHFWDGPAATLEEQAAGPMPGHDVVTERIRAITGYRRYFLKAFGDETVTIDHITKAIADYERTFGALEGEGDEDTPPEVFPL